jgi:hypothetical protein
LFNVLLSLGSNYEHIVEAKVENLSTSFLWWSQMLVMHQLANNLIATSNSYKCWLVSWFIYFDHIQMSLLVFGVIKIVQGNYVNSSSSTFKKLLLITLNAPLL